MNNLHFITVRNHGMVVVSNSSRSYDITDDGGVLVEHIPAGMVLRWKTDDMDEAGIKFVGGVFTTDFSNDNEIREYIENNNLLG